MRLFRMSLSICLHNFRKWTSNYRVWVLAVFLILLVRRYTKVIGSFSELIGVPTSPWIYPFLYSFSYVKLLFFFPLLLLFCDAPFIDDNQPYVIARSGRTAWSIGQILYLFMASGVYFLFLNVITILLNVSHMEYTSEWGKVLGTLANTNAAGEIELQMIISSKVLYYFTPLQAMWFTFFLSWMVGFLLGLILYFLNSLTNTRIIGMSFASFLLLLDATFRGTHMAGHWFSPVSWCTLDYIDVGGTTKNPTIGYIYLALAMLIVILTVSSLFINRKQAIHVVPPI